MAVAVEIDRYKNAAELIVIFENKIANLLAFVYDVGVGKFY